MMRDAIAAAGFENIQISNIHIGRVVSGISTLVATKPVLPKAEPIEAASEATDNFDKESSDLPYSEGPKQKEPPKRKRGRPPKRTNNS